MTAHVDAARAAELADQLEREALRADRLSGVLREMQHHLAMDDWCGPTAGLLDRWTSETALVISILRTRDVLADATDRRSSTHDLSDIRSHLRRLVRRLDQRVDADTS